MKKHRFFNRYDYYLAFCFIISIVLFILCSSCTAPDRTTETLQKAGYSNIQTGNYGFFECGGDDAFATRFTATNPTGQRVSGVVCCGWFKGCTIRF